MTETLLDRLAKAKNTDEADAIIAEARNKWEADCAELERLARLYQNHDSKAHGMFQRLLRKANESGVVLDALSEPDVDFFWNIGNVMISQHKEGESEYAKLLRLESDITQIIFALQKLFILIKQPEILKAVEHLMEREEAPG